MEPPGRPESLGKKQDLVAARAVLQVATAIRTFKENSPPDVHSPMRALREAVWWFWESPRLPRRAKGTGYPKAYPWSCDARRRWTSSNGVKPPGGWRLVYEHLYPYALLRRDLLELSDAHGPPPAEAVCDLLSTRLLGAVITKDEDRRTPDRDAPQDWAAYKSDPWCRYQNRVSLSGFAPLESSDPP